MNNGGEVADQMVREAMQAAEIAIKLSALGVKNSLALALAYAKENPKVRGKTTLDRLLRENRELRIIPLQTNDLPQFKQYAKQYGVLFATVKDKNGQGEKVDIMFKAEDVSKLNRIYEQMGYHLPKNSEMSQRKKAPTRPPQKSVCAERGFPSTDARPSVRAAVRALNEAARKVATQTQTITNEKREGRS